MKSLFGIIDKLLGIFQKPLKLRFDPSLRIEKELKILEEEREKIIKRPVTAGLARRLDDIDARRKRLLEEQARIAARA